MTDITVQRDSSLFIFTPHTPAAQEWLTDNVESEPWQWLGASLVVERRFAADLAQGLLLDAGMEVE